MTKNATALYSDELNRKLFRCLQLMCQLTYYHCSFLPQSIKLITEKLFGEEYHKISGLCSAVFYFRMDSRNTILIKYELFKAASENSGGWLDC